ncbi:CC0125/CC1285 family lipoprotein [Elongatibacter sediminis]|uniref:Lipoprotein n=1 Tax=Elongatibacter sediminis TaxID=3119006 RepID=A0AAW9R8K5_9GAMM
MITFRTATVTLACVFLAACTGPSVYRPADTEGAIGYDETRLTTQQYRVSFRGNRSTSASAVRDYALLRAAEVTLQNGYDWFEVLSSNTQTAERERLTTATEPVPARRVSRSCGLLGCTTTVDSGYAGVRVMATREDDYHTAHVEFTMGDGEPQAPSRVYNAAELAQSIRDRRLNGA